MTLTTKKLGDCGLVCKGIPGGGMAYELKLTKTGALLFRLEDTDGHLQRFQTAANTIKVGKTSRIAVTRQIVTETHKAIQPGHDVSDIKSNDFDAPNEGASSDEIKKKKAAADKVDNAQRADYVAGQKASKQTAEPKAPGKPRRPRAQSRSGSAGTTMARSTRCGCGNRPGRRNKCWTTCSGASRKTFTR